MPSEISSEMLSGAINSLLSNPELLGSMMSMLSGVTESQGGTTNNGAEQASATNAEGSQSSSTPPTERSDSATAENPLGNILANPALMAQLPEVIATISPLLSGGFGGKESSHGNSDKHPSPDKRLALLIALKPYLSHERCEAIDYIMKINKLGTLFGSLNR